MPDTAMAAPEVRHDWTRDEALALFALPFADLIHRAQTIHRRYFDPNAVQVSTLLRPYVRVVVVYKS